MQTLYIKETNNVSNNFLEKLLFYYKKIFNIFTITSKDNTDNFLVDKNIDIDYET